MRLIRYWNNITWKLLDWLIWFLYGGMQRQSLEPTFRLPTSIRLVHYFNDVTRDSFPAFSRIDWSPITISCHVVTFLDKYWTKEKPIDFSLIKRCKRSLFEIFVWPSKTPLLIYHWLQSFDSLPYSIRVNKLETSNEFLKTQVLPFSLSLVLK